jgi:hypothetical protein
MRPWIVAVAIIASLVSASAQSVRPTPPLLSPNVPLDHDRLKE